MNYKTTLITGGNSGIGAQIAKNLLIKGEKVISLGLAIPNWNHKNLTSYEADLTDKDQTKNIACLLYTSPSPRDKRQSRMPSSA